MNANTNLPFFKPQQILEQNEDIIASVVENMQLGRLDSAIKQYSLLINNLVSISLEFDNYPVDEECSYEDMIKEFPDRLMRKDPLDEFRPTSSFYTPVPPTAPPCKECQANKYSSAKCRIDFAHVEPNAKLSETETQEFLCATEVLARQHKKKTFENLRKKNRVRKNYKRWTNMEKYTVMLAIARAGTKDYKKIAGCIENRNEEQLRNFIHKNFTGAELTDLINGKVPPPPPKYQPPPELRNLFAAPDGSDFWIPVSALAPVPGGKIGSFNDLMRLASATYISTTGATTAKSEQTNSNGTTTADKNQVRRDCPLTNDEVLTSNEHGEHCRSQPTLVTERSRASNKFENTSSSLAVTQLQSNFCLALDSPAHLKTYSRWRKVNEIHDVAYNSDATPAEYGQPGLASESSMRRPFSVSNLLKQLVGPLSIPSNSNNSNADTVATDADSSFSNLQSTQPDSISAAANQSRSHIEGNDSFDRAIGLTETDTIDDFSYSRLLANDNSCQFFDKLL